MQIREALSYDDVMLVPKHSYLDSRSDADLSTLISGVKLKIPIIAANMSSVCGPEMCTALNKFGGLGILHRMCSVEEQYDMAYQVVRKQCNADRQIDPYNLGFSFGVGDDWKDRVLHGITYANIACLDIAHADCDRVKIVLKDYYKVFGYFPLIIGQISTPIAIRNLWDCIPSDYRNTTSFKTSIGGGSMCTTRIKTGFGIPTLQSVMDIKETIYFYNNQYHCNIGLIADGGIKNSGDIVKSLAAGADAVMLGNLFAGTDEAPGDVIKGQSGNKYKIYRGSASFGDKKIRGEKTKHIEGEETLVPYKGPVEKVINTLLDGVRSGFSYGGAKNLKELQTNAEFVRITHAGFNESIPHGV